MNSFTRLILIATLLVFNAEAQAEEVQLKSDSPDRYTVKKGDTLWDIAGQYLEKPWRWPEIWQQNEQIENPHLIFPGDLLVLTHEGGRPGLRVVRNQKMADRPTVKLSPAIYVDPAVDAIPTIPPNAIAPFLTSPRVIERTELDKAAYITVGVEDNIVLGTSSQFYARGLSDDESEFFRIFRVGRAFEDPESGEILGYEALHLGDAKMLAFGEDVSKLEIIKSSEEISPGDKLVSSPRNIGLPHYHPHKPDTFVRGRIVASLSGVAEVGPLSVVVVSVGERDGIEPGHVLRILWHRGKTKDTVTGEIYELPDEQSGLLMVFRIFDKLSYGLVMESTRAIHIFDAVETP